MSSSTALPLDLPAGFSLWSYLGVSAVVAMKLKVGTKIYKCKLVAGLLLSF